VQEYTNEFRKMALMLYVPLTTEETLMKYIGGFPVYIHNIVFMFGPTNIDECFLQETYIEVGKIGVGVSRESSSKKDGKGKGIGKKENSATMNKYKLSCKHCKTKGHDDENFYQLHLEKR
jgi:hypothetical protein